MKSAAGRCLPAVLFIASLVCMGLFYPATAGAVTASWRFEPPSFDFGVRLPAEGPTVAKAFELRNTGEVSLTPTLISVTNQRQSAFEMAGNHCHTLAPGAGCTVEVTFDPGGGGRYEGTLAVESSSPVVAATAQLLGSGGEPIVVIDPPAVAFDTVTIPTATLPTSGSARTITVTNAGSTDLSIEGLGYQEAASSSSRPNFASQGGVIGPGLCVRATISPGGSCSIKMDFDPDSPGAYSAELQLEDDAADSPQVIPLFGTAVAETHTAPPPAPKGASFPSLVRKPPLRTRSRTATFDFAADSSPGGFKCRSSAKQRFRTCTSPVRLHRLKLGLHVFSVRGVGADGLPGPVLTYHWRIAR